MNLYMFFLPDRPKAYREAPAYPDPINVDQETLVLRRGGFAPPLSLLIPTSAFQYAPEPLPEILHGILNAPLPIDMSIPRLRLSAYARLLSMRKDSISELLRTL